MLYEEGDSFSTVQVLATEPHAALSSLHCGSVWLGKIKYKYLIDVYFICVRFFKRSSKLLD